MIILKEKDTSHILWKDLFSSCSGMNSYHCYPNGPRSISNCHLKIRVICLKTFKKNKTFKRNSTILLLIIIQGTRFSGKKIYVFLSSFYKTRLITLQRLLEGAMWRGGCFYGSILCWNHYLMAFPINKVYLYSGEEDLYQTNFIKEN